MPDAPVGYFLTFSAYGHRLHGSEQTSVDREHSLHGTRKMVDSEARLTRAFRQMAELPLILNSHQRSLTLNSVMRNAAAKKWLLCAAHVRPTHVHLVLCCPCKPELALVNTKSHATHVLQATDVERRRWWARHGSTRYLWNRDQMCAAIDYTLNSQGKPMNFYHCETWRSSLDNDRHAFNSPSIHP